MTIEEIAESTELLEVGGKAIEAALVECQSSRISECTINSGLVIRERDGSSSSIIRFGPKAALWIGLRAIAKHLNQEKP